MERFKATLAALAVVLLPAGAHAQDQELSTDEVRQFFEDIGPEAEQAVAEGNWQGIQNWMQDHVADDANIAVQGSFIAGDGPTMSYQATMRGVDLKRASALHMSMTGPQMMGPAIQDYAVDVSVESVTELSGGGIAADVMFREHGVLDLEALAEAAAQQAGGQQTAGQQAGGMPDLPPEALEPKSFVDTSECSFRVARQDGDIVITLAACESVTTM